MPRKKADPLTTGPLRAAIYARISKDSEQSGLGVERQETDCRKLADLRGWEVDESWVIVENDTSATRGKRPKFERLIRGMESGAFDVVIAYRLDRLQRTLKDLIRMTEAHKRSGVLIATAQGDLDLSTTSGRVQAKLLGVIADIEIENMSERLLRKAQENSQKGRPTNGGSRPFGWELDRKTQRPDEAAMIQEVAQRIIQGASITSMCRYMEASGFLTPGKAVRDAEGNVTGAIKQMKWTTPRLKQMLLRPRHAGIVTYKDEVVLDKHGRPVKAEWDPILTIEQHERLKVALGSRSFTPDGWTNSRRHLLSGLLSCGVCGAKMGTGHNGERNGRASAWQYRCRQHVSRKRDHVDRYVLDQVIERAQTHPVHIGEWQSDEQEEIRQQIEAKKAQLADLVENFVASGGSVALLAQMTRALEAEIEDLQGERLGRLEVVTGAQWAMFDMSAVFEESASLMPRTEGSTKAGDLMEVQRQMIQIYVDRVVVHPAKRGKFSAEYIDIEWADENRVRWIGTLEASD